MTNGSQSPTDQASDAAASRAKLRELLQSDPDSRKLEQLGAALLATLLDVDFVLAKSGFQHGGDAGTVGRGGRRLRLEAKKYGQATALSDRELIGEYRQALAADPALEAWVLVAIDVSSPRLPLSS